MQPNYPFYIASSVNRQRPVMALFGMLSSQFSKPCMLQVAGASHIGFFRKLVVVKLSMQSKPQLVVIKAFDTIGEPVVLLDGNQLSCFSAFECLPWLASLRTDMVAIALQQIISEGLSSYLLPVVALKMVKLGCISSAESFSQVRIPAYIVISFSHAAFLLLVDGVATTTLAGFGVAFYFGGAV